MTGFAFDDGYFDFGLGRGGLDVASFFIEPFNTVANNGKGQ